MCVRFVILVMAMSVLGRTNGQFQRMFKEPSILDEPAGTGKILIQSELKIDTVHMPDACKVQAKAGDTVVFDFDFIFCLLGVEAGITNICIGEKRRLTIPPHLAWGEKGIPEVIPENAYVTFDLELVEIVPKTWGQWYIDMVQMVCTIGFAIGTFYLLIQQVRASRKSRRDAARRERKRLKLRAQMEEDEEDDEYEDDEDDDEEEEEENEEEEEEVNENEDNTDKQNTEWTNFQKHAKAE
ncbi:peptidyl-prolyl cis-trans isomerase FKBP11-like [Argopecten irradians]|uniref:peptidyl-prolyl cis-trans isomerase FKBP11-like n=1 Tax=Argopecten irradians TaxID=31199 RepID=UPI0037236547